MHVSRINPEENLVVAKIGKALHHLPAAVDLDSYFAKHCKGSRVTSGSNREFSDREFYKLGKQIARM